MQKKKVREQLISTPMIFKTKDGKFSVNGLYLASNSTHVRLKRVDNNTEVTVELKLLSEETVEQIKARKQGVLNSTQGACETHRRTQTRRTTRGQACKTGA